MSWILIAGLLGAGLLGFFTVVTKTASVKEIYAGVGLLGVASTVVGFVLSLAKASHLARDYSTGQLSDDPNEDKISWLNGAIVYLIAACFCAAVGGFIGWLVLRLRNDPEHEDYLDID